MARQDGAGRHSRLSVQPVTQDEWPIVCKMGGSSTFTPRTFVKNRLPLFRRALQGRDISPQGPPIRPV